MIAAADPATGPRAGPDESMALGHLAEGVHILPLRVYYEDTDAGGLVYHSRYLNYAERARSELLRLLGIHQAELMAAEGVAFAVRDCSMEFLKPARFDERLEIRSRLVEIAAAWISAEQDIWRGGDRLVAIKIRVAAVRRNGRPTRIPGPVRAALAPVILSQQQG